MLNPTVIRRFAAMNGASFPEDLAQRVDEAPAGDAAAIATEAATTLCDELLAGGVPGLHIYCLNRSSVALGILKGLGVR